MISRAVFSLIIMESYMLELTRDLCVLGADRADVAAGVVAALAPIPVVCELETFYIKRLRLTF